MKCSFKVLLLLFLFSSFARSALACECGILHNILNALGDKVVTGITVPLDQAIREAAYFEAGSIREDLSALREAILLTKDTLSQTLQANDQNAAEREILRTYDPGSQPGTICDNNLMGAAYQLSVTTVGVARSDIQDRLLERRERYPRPVDYLSEGRDENWPGPEKVLKVLGLKGEATTLTLEEVGDAQRLIESLSNPLPPFNLPEEFLETPAGRAYLAQKKDFETRQAFYQGILSQRVANLSPTTEGLADWAQDKWQQMGGQGEPPGLVEGRLSEDSLFWYLTNQRLASANWFENVVPTLPEAGLLRELVTMEAVVLELLRRQNTHLENISFLLAQRALEELQGAPLEALNAQYSRATSQSAHN
ncbi:MAG: hypothetical protein LBF22_10510 [Deltaproteobacteria bacterium]|jgi:hypothetical protein|nr:hypothetical protein [Deltaproteobacteria bacterium]